MRWKVQLSARASACASVVLPTPGTSSIRRWPPASSATMARRTASGLPRMTRSMAACKRATASAASATDIKPSLSAG